MSSFFFSGSKNKQTNIKATRQWKLGASNYNINDNLRYPAISTFTVFYITYILYVRLQNLRFFQLSSKNMNDVKMFRFKNKFLSRNTVIKTSKNLEIRRFSKTANFDTALIIPISFKFL